VHWIQAKIKRDEPRHNARIEVIAGNKLRVSYLDQSQIFSHHAVEQIQAALNSAVLGYIKFAPSASLLYVQTEEANGQQHGVFSVSYLCAGELTDCLPPSPDAVSIEEIELED
jgi:hypothetical protein